MVDRTADFMLEEYKQIANGYQDLHAQQNQLIQFYLTLVAVPASILAVASQFITKLSPQAPASTTVPAGTPAATQTVIPGVAPTSVPPGLPLATPDAITALGTPIALALMVALCVIGFAVLVALVYTRAEALLYVRTINVVRRYFVEHDLEGKLSSFLVLPQHDKFPRYWEGIASRSFWNVVLIASLNSAVLFATLMSALWALQYSGAIWISLASAIGWFGFQELVHWVILNQEEKNYHVKFPNPFPMRPVIGIDLDGVLGDLAEGVIKTAEAKYGIKIDLKDITSHRLQDCTPLTEPQVQEIFKSTDIFRTLSPLPNASEALDKLHEKGWVVHVITDRFWTDHDWTDADYWLEQNKFKRNDLSLVRAREKDRYAKANGISVFVEDNYDTAKALGSVCPKVYLINWPYNQGPLPQAIKRAANWDEIMQDLFA